MKHLLSILLLGADFGKRTMGVQRSFILTEVYTVPGVLKKKQTLLSLVLVTKPSSLLLLVIYVWLIPAAPNSESQQSSVRTTVEP